MWRDSLVLLSRATVVVHLTSRHMAHAESCVLGFYRSLTFSSVPCPMTIHWSWHHTPREPFSAVQRWHSCHASRYPLTLIFVSPALQNPWTLCLAPQSLNEVSQQALGFCREDEVLPNALSCRTSSSYFISLLFLLPWSSQSQLPWGLWTLIFVYLHRDAGCANWSVLV